MALDPIAQARIELDLNEDALVQGLQRVERQHARTMREIDRSRAEATIDLDTSHYDDAIKNVKRELKELDGQKATGTLEIDDKAFEKKVNKLKKELRDLEGQKATVELELKGEAEFHKAQARMEKADNKRVAAAEARDAAIRKARITADRRAAAINARLQAQIDRGLIREGNLRLVAAKREAEYSRQREQALVREGNLHLMAARREAEYSKQREQSFIREGNVRTALMRREQQRQRAEEQAEMRRQRELNSIPRLQREYADLSLQLEKLAAARRKAFPDRRSQLRVDLQVAETEAKMRALVAELERIGEDVDVRINFRTGQQMGVHVRQAIRESGMMTAGMVMGRDIGLGMLRGIQDTFTPSNIFARVANTSRNLVGMLGALSEATIRIGPFTTSIRTLMIALTVLGPTIVDLVGAVGALVGVVGTGLTGAMALGAGAVGAFGVALGGVGFLIPSLLKDFKELNSLQDAYHKQVLKTGENSDKAKKKLKEFNHALGEVQPTTREAFLRLNEIQDAWGNMAQAVRPQFFDALGESIRTVNHHFEWFSDNTQRSFTILTDGWRKWMEGLRGEEAGVILRTLGSNGRRSLTPLMEAIGNLTTWFGRIAANASNYLPGLMRQFSAWSQAVADGVGPTTNLSDRIGRLVEHARSLGRFLAASGRFLVSFFNGGAEAGESFLDTMTNALNRWTEFNRSVEGRQSLHQFFTRSVEGAQALYAVLAPIAQTFVQWATQISPVVAGFLEGTGAVFSFVGQIVRLVGLQDSLSAIVTTLGAIWAVGRIKAATQAVTAFSTALLGMGGASAVATGAGGAAASRTMWQTLLGVPSGTVIGPAQKRMGNVIRTVGLRAVRGAGLIGVGVLAMELIGKGMQTAVARGGGTSTLVGISRDLLNTVSFGIADSAEETSKKAAKEVVGALRRNIDLELNSNTKLGGKGMNTVSTLDLTIDDKKMAANFQLALQKADQLVRDHKLPDLSQTVRVKSNPQDLQTIQNNWNRLKNNLATTVETLKRNTDETLAAMKRSMDLNTAQGASQVAKNMQLTVQSIDRSMDRGGMAASEGLREIRRQFAVHTQAAAKSADRNFAHAKTAIQNAVQDGQISSEKGLREIRRLWVEYLKLYGFSESQARNIAAGNRQDAGPEEGTRGPGRSGTRARRAQGGLVNIGTPGRRGQDTVPMNLGGVPSIVAPGEQIAVFNRHQQRAINSYVPGGLEGFFASHRKPHYAAAGGIVPVPGFPGERAASSILDEIASVTSRFGLRLTDAYGPGHQSPGHTVTGTAADFAGPDRNMDAAVKALVAAGYLVGYDGRFGSQKWPGHGPSTVAGGNAHLHVEFGGRGGSYMGIEAQTIERQLVTKGLGAVTTLTQAAVDIVRDAAQANLDAVARESLTLMAAGGGDGAGAGGAPPEQIRRWIEAGLRLAGEPVTSGAINTLYGRIMQESGGNPMAQNNWDINAKRGTPSKGILQTIDPTFNAYKVPGFSDIWNPVHNIAAAVRYMRARYGRLVGRSNSGYALGGLVTMAQNEWARGGKVERPTLMTGEDGRKSPEYVIGTNPAFRKTNLQALTGAANALGVPMARKSKTGTIKPKLVGGTGKDPENLREVKAYSRQQGKEDDQRRKISIAESQVKEPDTLIKQQGTDANGNPLYVVDEAKLNSYVAMMDAVRKLYDGMLAIMDELASRARAAFQALQAYRDKRTANIQALDAQNKINKKLMRSKDEHTRQAAERRYNAGIEMRSDQVRLRNDAWSVRERISEDQHDAKFRVQEYGIARQSVIEDIQAVGTKAAADAVSETRSAYQEPESPPDLPSPGESAVSRFETELALAQAGYGMNGALGSQRAVADIINDLIAANETRITEAQAMLTDTDATNDQDAYQAITQAASAIKGLREDLKADEGPDQATQFHTMGAAMLDLYRNFGSNMFSTGAAGGNVAGVHLGGGYTTNVGGKGAAAAAGGPIINIEQNFPTQPDPMTWAQSTKFELNAAL